MLKIPIIALLVVLLAGCQSTPTLLNPSWPTPTPVAGQLRPYVTPTATLQPDANAPRPTPVFTHTPLPSPTPFVHIVKRGDTMLGIALFYGVELAALKAANPTVDPQFMSIGTQLVIPLIGTETTTEPTPTPLPLIVNSPVCFPQGDGSLWCSLVLQNADSQSVENIGVLLDLVGPDGGLVSSQVLFTPLNRLPADGRIGLAARFPALAGAQLQPYASLLTAAPVGEELARYLEVQHTGEQIIIDPGGRKAQYRSLAQVMGPAQTFWVVVSAFDNQGRLVGQRKLTYDAVCTAEVMAENGTCPVLVLEGTLYSTGPEIAQVLIQSEARP